MGECNLYRFISKENDGKHERNESAIRADQNVSRTIFLVSRTHVCSSVLFAMNIHFFSPFIFIELSKDVLKETNSIHDGIGLPDWKLVICLGFAWICITLILIKGMLLEYNIIYYNTVIKTNSGIRSSGKASYFLAIFPYVIMGVLLVRAITLPGAGAGILYFITPQFDQLLNPKVWYAAVSQVFFSLAICFGNIIMYSSFNRFSQNVYR